ncbi:serine/threonine-protein kinase [Sulfurimonas sp. SAG-AH-194-C20]|nr:leucine-rich repeat-containing protein kinase family protein [Sulfurimonas sp. SAG-AH-194-C20]MDF1879449.1 serine/threonine-protein kinase [Sulfurimonas sp. SAG-AH-194-C20]
MRHTLEELHSGKLVGIKKLKIQENLETFPEEIFTLCDSLELLDLSGNRLKNLPDLSRLKNLKIAFFSQNRFIKIPDAFRECHKLFMLGFKSNSIECFGEDILPPSISWLILTDNKLEQLPKSIGKLTKMQKFPLAGNRLTSLPQSMKNLKNLELIRLSANSLTEIPEWLLSLPKLAYLAFSGNPCCVSKESTLKLVQYKDLEVDELLGEGASGKIYRGHSKDFNRVVAIKLFKGAVTSDGYAKDEMNASMHAGEHPNLIKVLARLEHKHLGLVLEFIKPTYKNLGNPPNFETCSRDTFEEGLRLDVCEVLKVAKAIASAATHLHERGLMHGDLYAHNILVDGNYNTYLGDFGAASFYDVKDDLYEKVEVLAFGNLLEDLLNLVDVKKGLEYQYLVSLKERCQTSIVTLRPFFKELLFSFH